MPVSELKPAKLFPPKGDYDYASARAAGLGPDESGHWPSRVPSGPKEGLILKLPGHPTLQETLDEERLLGYTVSKKGGRYYSKKRYQSTSPLSMALQDWRANKLNQTIEVQPDGKVEFGEWYIAGEKGEPQKPPYSDWLKEHGWTAPMLHQLEYDRPALRRPAELSISKRVERDIKNWWTAGDVKYGTLPKVYDTPEGRKYVAQQPTREDMPLVRTLGAIATYYGAKYGTGRGLYTPELVFGPDLAEKLSSAVGGFEMTPDEKKAGDFIEFVGALKTAGQLMRPLAGLMFPTSVAKLYTGGGLTFMLRNLSEQTVDKIKKDKPFDKWSLLAETVVGVVTGGIEHGGIKLSRLYRWSTQFRNTPIGQKVPRRLWMRVDAAIRDKAGGASAKAIKKAYGKDIGNFAQAVSNASRSIQPQLPAGQVGYPSGGAIVPGGAGLPIEPKAKRAPLGIPAKITDKVAGAISKMIDKAYVARDIERVKQIEEGLANRIDVEEPFGADAHSIDVKRAEDLLWEVKHIRYALEKFPTDAAVPRRVLTPQRTQIEKSKFAQWATKYAQVRAMDLGVPLVPTDPAIQEHRLKTLTSMHRTRQRYVTKRRNKIDKSMGKPNYLNPWVSARYMWMDFEKRTGIPISHLTSNIYRKAGDAHLKGMEVLTDKIHLYEVAGMTPKDNEHIAKWLHGPATRAEVEGDIRPQALTVAMKLEDLFQGSEGTQLQEAVFRRWAKSGDPPKDIWQYTNAYAIANNYAIGENANELAGVINTAMRRNPTSVAKLMKSLGSAVKSAAKTLDKATQEKFIGLARNAEFLNEVMTRYRHPEQIMQEGTEARAEGRLSEWIAEQPPWGRRKFYYMTNPAKADIIDDYLDTMSLGALEKPKLPTNLPGTIPYETYARKRGAPIKEGSVINNSLTHFQRIRIANAVADDLEKLYKRFDWLPEGNKLTEQDKRVVKQMFNNLMMRRQVADAPFALMAQFRRAYWRPTMSWLWRPHTILWRSVRNAVQNYAMGPYAINMVAGVKESAKLGVGFLQGKNLEQYDPEMMMRYERDFHSYVSQRHAHYREFLLQDTANVTRDFSRRTTARKAIALMEQTGSLYGIVDEYVNRMPLWITQYQVVKSAANDFFAGKITLGDFFKQTRLEMVDETQQMLVEDTLEQGQVDDLAAEAAGWMTENVNLKYKTPERAGVEQTMDERSLLGIYTFPRGYGELMYRQGIRPMLKGVEEGDYGKAYRGASHLVQGIIASSLVSSLLYYYMGRRAYSVGQTLAYTMLDPGTGTVHNLFNWTWTQMLRYSNKEQSLVATVDNIAEAWFKVGETLAIPLTVEMENFYEAQHDKAGANLYRLVRNAMVSKLFGKEYVKKLPIVERSNKQALVHMLIGGYEYLPKTEEEGRLKGPTRPTIPQPP